MEDLIDFRVSPMWRDYYYLRGLTPHPSDEFLAARLAEASKSAELEELKADNAALRKRMAALEKAVAAKEQIKSPKRPKGDY